MNHRSPNDDDDNAAKETTRCARRSSSSSSSEMDLVLPHDHGAPPMCDKCVHRALCAPTVMATGSPLQYPPTNVVEMGVSTSHMIGSVSPPSVTWNHAVPTISSSSSSSQSSYIPYDEGMYLYSSSYEEDGGWSSIPTSDSTSDENKLQFFCHFGQSNIASGAYDQAIQCFQFVLERLSPQSNPLLYHMVSHNLGYCWYRLGERAAAARYYQQSLDIARAAALAPLHEAAAQNALAVLRLTNPSNNSAKDEEENVLQILQQCYDIYVQRFGAHSTRAATIQNNLARAFFLAGDYTQALQCFEPCLRIRFSLLGFQSMDVAVTICNIGQTYARLGRLDLALAHYQMFVTLCDKYFCSNHRDVATIVTYMADIYYRQRDFAKAQRHYERALEIRAAVWERGANDPLEDTIPILLQLGDILKQQKSFGSALNLYTKLCHIQSQVYGPNSHQVIGTLSCIAVIHYQQGNFTMALNQYTTVLQKQLILHSSTDHSDIAGTLNSIGLILFHQEVYHQAKTCFCESLRIKLKLLGPHHHEIAVLWYNIASVYYSQGDHDTAIAYYKESVRIDCERHGLNPDIPTRTTNASTPVKQAPLSAGSSIIRSLQKLGVIYQENGDFEEALKYFSQALELELQKGADARDNGSLGKLFNILGNIHLQCANIDQMMKCYIQASRIYRRMNDRHRVSFTISGYGFYYLSRMYPPCAATA